MKLKKNVKEHCLGKQLQQRTDWHKKVSPDAKYFPLESKDKDVTDPVWPARTATCCFVVTSQRRMLLSLEPVKNSEESKCKTKTNQKKYSRM